MRSLVALAVLLVLPISPAMGQEMSGDEILRRSEQVYTDITTYRGATGVLWEFAMPDTTTVQATSLEVFHESPSRWRLSGLDIRGEPYLLIADGEEVFVQLIQPTAEAAAGLAGFVQGEAVGDTVRIRSIDFEMALAMVMGIGNRAPFYSVALLAQGPRNRMVGDAPSTRLRSERCGPGTCHVVAVDAPTLRATWWIDDETFLVRRYTEEQTGGELSRMGRQIVEADSTRREGAVIDVIGSMVGGSDYRVVFSAMEIDGVLPEDVFEIPGAWSP